MGLTSEEIKQAIHRLDLIQRPWIIFINHIQAKALKTAIPRIEDEVVIQETENVEVGKAIAIERKKLEEWVNGNEFR